MVGSDTAPLHGQLRIGLLSLLLARANTPVLAESLQDWLWREDDDSVRAQRLQTNVARLRKHLDTPERLTFTAGTYTLHVHPDELDSDQFDDLASRATHTDDPHQRASLLRSALELWRGTPYQGVDLAELASHTQRLTERRQVALEELYTAELERGRHTEIIADVVDLAQLNPYRERLHALLMTALYRSGRQADALAAYHHARQTLVEDLGLEPGPELRAVEAQILAGEDSTLARPTPTPIAPPAQLPPGPHDFVGRTDELAALDRHSVASAEATRVVVVTGTAGAGKTALVTHWAHHARARFPDGQLYVDLQGFSPDDPMPSAVALGGFLRALGEDSSAIPHDPVERAARFRTLTEGRRVLVVLDNAATADQVRPLLPGSVSCSVVVTSRATLSGLTVGHGAHRIDIGRMDQNEARALLSARAPNMNSSQKSVSRLVEHCARLPLVLRVTAERLRATNSGDVANLVAELDSEQHRLDLFDTGDDHTSIRAVLSWSYQQLTSEAARLFRMCGFYCEHTSHNLDASGAAALLETRDVRTARQLLSELERCGLVEQRPDGFFYVHQLLQSYAAELANHHEREATAPRLIGLFLNGAIAAAEFLQPPELPPRVEGLSSASAPELTGCAVAMRWLDNYRGNLICMANLVAEVGRHDVIIDLSATLWPYFDLGNHLDEAEHLHTLARAAAHELGDRAAEAIAVRGLGLLELRLGRYDAAERYLREALELHTADNTRAPRATTQTYLACVLTVTGRVSHAMTLAREVLDTEPGHTLVQATATNTLGRLLGQHGRHQEATWCLRIAHDTADWHGHRPFQAHALFSLAEVYRDTGRDSLATEYARRAFDLAKESGITGLVEKITALRGSIPTGTSDDTTAADLLLDRPR